MTLYKQNTLLKSAILIPLAFLIIYHTSKLYHIYFEDDYVTTTEFLNSFRNGFSATSIVTIQSILRGTIIISLLLVALNKKLGIIVMWIGIASLILTQFYTASASTSTIIQSAYSGLKPLKGLILPIVISYIYIKINQPKK